MSIPAASMAQPRRGHQTLLLANNNTVLITGGTSAGAAVSSAEQFVPWTGELTSTGSPANSRTSAAVSNLSADGTAWLAAGRATDGSAIKASELYGFATIKTDRNDYSPGMTVVMTGSGWEPGETVSLLLHEVATGHADRTLSAVADDAGRIVNTEFTVDAQHIGVRFVLTARGAASQAQITFTDGNLQSVITFNIGPASVDVAAALSWSATATCDNGGGPSNTCAGNGFTVGGSVADTYSLEIQQATNVNFTGGSVVTRQLSSTTAGAAAGSFTAPAAAGTYFYRIRHASQTIGSNTWQPQNSAVVTITVTSCTAPAVTTQPSLQSVTYGQNASFTAAASGAPNPTVQWQVSTNGGGSWTNLGGQTATTLTLTRPSVSMTEGNQYRAVFTNSCTPATATSNAAALAVNPKNLTISGAVAQNKVDDGTAAATVSFGGAALVGVESGDVVSINSTGYAVTFANKTAGISKPVTVTGVTLSGAAAGNYTVSQPSGLAANITPKSLTGASPRRTSLRLHDRRHRGADRAGRCDCSGCGHPECHWGRVRHEGGRHGQDGDGDLALAGADAGQLRGQLDGDHDGQHHGQGADRQLTAENKVYDGTTAATVATTALPGVIAPDVVTVNAPGQHSTRSGRDRQDGDGERDRSAAPTRATTRQHSPPATTADITAARVLPPAAA